MKHPPNPFWQKIKRLYPKKREIKFITSRDYETIQKGENWSFICNLDCCQREKCYPDVKYKEVESSHLRS